MSESVKSNVLQKTCQTCGHTHMLKYVERLRYLDNEYLHYCGLTAAIHKPVKYFVKLNNMPRRYTTDRNKFLNTLDFFGVENTTDLLQSLESKEEM